MEGCAQIGLGMVAGPAAPRAWLQHVAASEVGADVEDGGNVAAARIIHEGALGLCVMAKYFFIIFFLFSHGRRATVGNFARSRPSSSSFGHAIVAHPGRGAGSAAFGLTASSDMDRKRASIRREPPRTSEKKKTAERTRKRGRDCLHTNNSNKCYILLAHDLIRAVIWLDCLRR